MPEIKKQPPKPRTRKPRKEPTAKEAKHYYIVNPAGCVHEVTRDHAVERLKQIGYRMASEKEIEAYKKFDVQTFDNPIAEPWSPDVDLEPEVD